MTIQQTVAKVAANSELLEDAEVRKYVAARSVTSNYYVALKLFDLILPLHEQGFVDEAVSCFRLLSHVDDPMIWDPKGNNFYHLLATKAFKDIIGCETLLVSHPQTWGLLAVQVFSSLLGAVWASDWDSSTAQPGDFERHRPNWFVDPSQSTFNARWLVGQAVRDTLRQAAGDDQADTFRIFADRLIGIQWSIAFNLVLESLFDALQARPRVWYTPESIRALCLPQIVQSRSTYDLRRLLRLALPSDLALSDRQAMLGALRDSSTDEFMRRNELADFQDWGVLSDEEQREVEEARAAGKLFLPRNPFDRSDFQEAKWVPSDSWQEAQADRWPYPDDRSHLNRLWERDTREKSEAPPDFNGDLGPRLEGLRTILRRPEINHEEWFGTILRFCRQALGDLKSWHRAQGNQPSNNGAFGNHELKSLYDTHVPWWELLVPMAIARLGGAIPHEHSRSDREFLVWTSGDPLIESLQFLDEFLVVGPGEPFDALRRRFAEVMTEVWDRWPPYTRATALAVLRPYHWATVPGLSINIDRTLGIETSPQVLDFCLATLLRSSSSVAERLRNLTRRIAPLPGMSTIAEKVGQVIGNAVIRSRGDAEESTELKAVASLAEEFADPFDSIMGFRLHLASGLLWGASSTLGSVESLTNRHAKCWLPLAYRSLGEWLDKKDDERTDRLPVNPMMNVLELRWPHDIRTSLYDNLADVLVRIIDEAGLSTFCMLHFLLCQELKGEPRVGRSGHDRAGPSPQMPLAISDEVLVRLSCASAQRISRWAAEGKRTNDLGFAGTLAGRETAELMKLTFSKGTDKGFLRRGLAPLVDLVADAGFMELATDLRLYLRRG